MTAHDGLLSEVGPGTRSRALRLGTAEAEQVLRRFTRAGPKHPTYRAIAELGRDASPYGRFELGMNSRLDVHQSGLEQVQREHGDLLGFSVRTGQVAVLAVEEEARAMRLERTCARSKAPLAPGPPRPCCAATLPHCAALRRTAEDSHALFAELGDRWGQLQTTYPLAALAAITGDYTRAARLHQDGLRLAEDLGFWPDAADRPTGLGRVALLTGDFPQATELHRKAMALAAEHGYAAGETHAEIGLALTARREGDFDRAEKYLRKTLAWHREVAFGPGPALLLAELGFLAEQRGDASAALSLHHQGLSVARDSGDPRALALAHEGLAGAYALAGQPVRAARLLGTAARARESSGAALPEAERGDVERITTKTLAMLGPEMFAAEFSVGIDDGRHLERPERATGREG